MESPSPRPNLTMPPQTPVARPPSGAELRVLTLKEVQRKIGRCRTTIHSLVRDDPSFPKPFHMGTRSIGWLSSEIDAWLVKRAVEHRKIVTREVPKQLQNTRKKKSA